MSDSLWPHGLQHSRLPYPSPTPGACSNSGPSSQWCHPTISSSVVPFSSCPQSFPALESFPMRQFFASGDQSIGVSASASDICIHVSVLFQFRLLQSIEQGSLRYTVGPCSLSELNIALCICQSQTPSQSLRHTLSLLAIINLFSKSVSLFLFCKWVHLYHCFGFCI